MEEVPFSFLSAENYNATPGQYAASGNWVMVVAAVMVEWMGGAAQVEARKLGSKPNAPQQVTPPHAPRRQTARTHPHHPILR